MRFVDDVKRGRVGMKPGHRYTIGVQPCQQIKRGESCMPGVQNVHQCPKCEGHRTWCDNCYADHHDGGWQTCKPGAYKEDDTENEA